MHHHNYVAQNYNIQTDFNNWMDEDECDVNAKNPHDDNHLNEVSSVYNLGTHGSCNLNQQNLCATFNGGFDKVLQVGCMYSYTDFISLLSMTGYKRCILPGECSHVVIMITSLHE